MLRWVLSLLLLATSPVEGKRERGRAGQVGSWTPELRMPKLSQGIVLTE